MHAITLIMPLPTTLGHAGLVRGCVPVRSRWLRRSSDRSIPRKRICRGNRGTLGSDRPRLAAGRRTVSRMRIVCGCAATTTRHSRHSRPSRRASRHDTGQFEGEPTISPAPAESTPPADPAPAEPQPMAREIEPVSEYLTPPATLPTSVSTGAGALKPTLWVPTAPTN